jgi:hypothetical protein
MLTMFMGLKIVAFMFRLLVTVGAIVGIAWFCLKAGNDVK